MQNRLKKAVVSSRLSPEIIAKRARVTLNDLYDYCEGIRIPQVKAANRLGRVLGTTGAELVIGTPQTIGDRLKTIRFDADLSLEQMGVAIGVMSTTISHWEGGWTPHLFAIITYAETFGVSLDWLLLGKGAPYA